MIEAKRVSHATFETADVEGPSGLPQPDPLSRDNDTGISDLFRSRRLLVLAKFRDRPVSLRYSPDYSSVHR